MPTKTHQFTGVFGELLEEVGPVEPFIVTDELSLQMPTKAVVKQFYESEPNSDVRTRILMGPIFDEVSALFDDKNHKMWDRFLEMYYEFVFGKGATKVEGN